MRPSTIHTTSGCACLALVGRPAVAIGSGRLPTVTYQGSRYDHGAPAPAPARRVSRRQRDDDGGWLGRRPARNDGRVWSRGQRSCGWEQGSLEKRTNHTVMLAAFTEHHLASEDNTRGGRLLCVVPAHPSCLRAFLLRGRRHVPPR